MDDFDAVPTETGLNLSLGDPSKPTYQQRLLARISSLLAADKENTQTNQ